MLGIWILALFLLSTAEGKHMGLVFIQPFYAAMFCEILFYTMVP